MSQNPTLVIPADDTLKLHLNAYSKSLKSALELLLNCPTSEQNPRAGAQEFERAVDRLKFGFLKSPNLSIKKGGPYFTKPGSIAILNMNRAHKLYELLWSRLNPEDPAHDLLTGDVSYLKETQQLFIDNFGEELNDTSMDGKNPRRWLRTCLSLLRALFDYDSFRDGKLLKVEDGKIWWGTSKKSIWDGAEYVKRMTRQVRYCPYCNAERVYAVELKDRRRKPYVSALDHFLPRSRYPYFALSLYNLVPSCTRCNSQLKHDEMITFKNVLHPYLDDLYDAFRFKLSIPNVTSFQPLSEDCKFTLRVKYKDGAEGDNARNLFGNVFRLGRVYNVLYKPEVIEIVSRLKYISPSVIQDLMKRFNLSKASVNRMLFNSDFDERNVLKSRFGKLTCDMRKQFSPKI